MADGKHWKHAYRYNFGYVSDTCSSKPLTGIQLVSWSFASVGSRYLYISYYQILLALFSKCLYRHNAASLVFRTIALSNELAALKSGCLISLPSHQKRCALRSRTNTYGDHISNGEIWKCSQLFLPQGTSLLRWTADAPRALPDYRQTLPAVINLALVSIGVCANHFEAGRYFWSNSWRVSLGQLPINFMISYELIL